MMLADNRLDFITNIEQEYIDKMTALRQEFIALDKELRDLSADDRINKSGAARCLSIARTNVETALQYTIKTLCLMGEMNHNS